MKFGGTSVRDEGSLNRLCDIVARERRPKLVVVSALAGVTDQLVSLAAAAGDSDGSALRTAVDRLRQRHVDLASDVVAHPERDTLIDAIDHTCRALDALVHAVGVLHELSPRSADAIAAIGESLSGRLVAAALASSHLGGHWVDALQVLVTNDAHGRAQPLMDATTAHVRDIVAPVIESGHVPVIGGFIGATQSGVTTTLGRGGSDYSAAIFGAALDAEEIQIWTDVDGMLTADPRIVKTARLVRHLSFAEASELAYFGATVLHPATIQPAVERDMPIRILNARRPEGPGTKISSSPAVAAPVTALACKRGLTVIEITSARMLMAHGFLRRLFEVFDRLETPVDVVTTSEVNVSVTIDNPAHLADLVANLSTFAEVSTEPDMALLCVVGEGLRADPTLFPQVVGTLDGISCRMVSQSASRRNLTFVLRETDLAQALTRLHDHCFAPVDAAPL